MEEDEISWIDWFLSKKCNQYFVRIDQIFITNSFNYYGLKQKVPRFKEAISMITGKYTETDDADLVEQACRLYGLIHARFLITESGLKKMGVIYASGNFQNCPRFLCSGFQCLPYGPSEVEGESSLKLFCPNCGDVYDPCYSYLNKIDGAYFGPSWVHIFLQFYPNLVSKVPPVPYVPRIFGFKVSDPDDDASETEESK